MPWHDIASLYVYSGIEKKNDKTIKTETNYFKCQKKSNRK